MCQQARICSEEREPSKSENGALTPSRHGGRVVFDWHGSYRLFRKRYLFMKRLMLIIVALAITGCADVKQEDTAIKARNQAEEAAVKRIVVVEGDQIPGHPKYTELGKTQGVCVRAAWYDDDSSIDRIGFKHAAYDKYGDKVDAIIKVNSFFVVDNQSNGNGMGQPGSAAGHLNCQGVAVHFEPN